MSEPRVTEADWEAVERAIWPKGPAAGHGSGVYAALKARVQAELGQPKCQRCGDIAYQPDAIAGRRQAWRCGGCHRTLSRCNCTESK